MTEDQLQAKLWEYTWNTYPHSRGHMWAVPNGLQLPMLLAIKAKMTGLLEGVWDLHIFYNRQFRIIETKVGNGKLSVDRVVVKNGKPRKHRGQKEWGDLMHKHGARRFVYWSFEEGKQVIDSIFGVPPMSMVD